jgi:hypothetical protein
MVGLEVVAMTMHMRPLGETEEPVYIMFHSSGYPVFYCNFCEWDLEIRCSYWYLWAEQHNYRHQQEEAFLDYLGLSPREATELMVVKNRWEFPEEMDR